jgi:hypothetical protein
MAMGAPKDWWDKPQIIGALVTGLVTPAIVVIVGGWINSSLKKRDERVQMTSVAVDVLKGAPRQTEGDRALRRWAVGLLKRNSDMPLPADAEQALLEAPLFTLPEATGEFELQFTSDPSGAKVYMLDSRYDYVPNDDAEVPEYVEKEYGQLAVTTPWKKSFSVNSFGHGTYALFVWHGQVKRAEVPQQSKEPGKPAVVHVKFDK